MTQFFYTRIVNGAPQGPLLNAAPVQQMNPALTTTVDSLTNEQLAEIGFARVHAPKFPVDGYHYKQGPVVQVNGVWTVTWEQQETPDRDYYLRSRSADARKGRNQLLSESDWTQISDAPLTAEQKAAWAAYRQELRDLTSQPNFPWEVMWPAKP